LNNKVNIEWFIRTMQRRTFPPDAYRRVAMFLFNRSVLSVCLALVIAGLPVVLQYL
jgi:hypothetical protein